MIWLGLAQFALGLVSGWLFANARTDKAVRRLERRIVALQAHVRVHQTLAAARSPRFRDPYRSTDPDCPCPRKPG